MRPTVSLLTLGSILLLGGGPVAAAPEEWACDLRAWTRAPDLSPGLSTLAEARLAGNGTACNEIDRWEVGLRFKERAIIKLRARNVGDFPAKPTRAPFNATSHPRPDWNDIYLPQNTWFDSNDDSYKEAMEKYNAAIRDKSLWEVHGDERVVFDIKQELPIDGSGDTELDVVAPFFVHVPLTNMLNTETMFEYYHLIHLKNGTTIDIPAGRAGFLPHPTPATPSWRACEVCAKDWPRSMELHSPRLEEDRLDKEMGLGMYGPRAPKCDAGNLANFSLEVTSDTPYAVQGKNISLHIKLTRTGNGSEYPAYLDLTHALARNVTWAYRFVSSVEEYAALTSGDHGALRFSSHPRHRPSPGRMLMITTQRELEEQRNREEAQRERGFGGVSYSSGRGGRWPLGNNQARYDFEESGDEYVDVYEFDVELPIRHDDMPSFVKTFENLESVIDLDLHTTFLCDRDNEPEGASDTSAGHRSASDERDAEWKEYSLPLRPANRTISSRSGLSHRGSITLDMRLANLSSSLEEGQDVAHYLDTEARSPILSSAASRPGPAAFPALGSSLRPENKAELVKSRYGPSEWRHMRRDRCKSENRGEGCWKLNGGGAWMHAAKLWQGRRDEAERVQPESYDVELGQPGLVIQTITKKDRIPGRSLARNDPLSHTSMASALQPEPQRSQSTTSLSRFYNGVNGNGLPLGEEEIHDPKLDFCNAFWGQNERGYDVVMARLRGAGRTVDELRTFWKERAAIEEDYAKRLSKLAKTSLGKDEIGDLKSSLENVLTETAQQASYHLSLSNELRTSVEAPTTEFSARLSNLKKGLQASVEKSYRNKGLQEGHVAKAKERYESDCLKLNSYTANQALTQGKEAEKLQMKLQKVRQTIGQNEQEFRQFVGIYQETSQKWEMEWKGFCDHVQDLEEDRLALVKDIVWAYANAVSQVCVEDDSSCERIREKLEQFEPINDMVAFVRGWGTGDAIPDPPKFINYSAGEYPSAPTSHPASFHRLSAKPPMSAVSLSQRSAAPELEIPPVEPEAVQRNGDAPPATNGWVSGMQGLSLKDEPEPIASVAEPEEKEVKPPFGGVALPGMASSPPSTATALPKRQSSMPPPPVPPSIPMPEPRVPSRQGPPTPQAVDEEDPMAKALADLRREPPPPASVRRNPSHRRPESVYSTAGSARSPIIGKPASPAPGSNRASFQQAQGVPPAQSRSSIDMGLSPPASGHTAAALARSMDEFQRQSNRQSTNYSAFASDVVGAHPSSRSGSPAPGARAPSPAMMQPPTQPATHIADEVLSQYHQAFPGERSRSRAGSIRSGRSRASSLNIAPPQSAQPGPPSPTPRAGFVGIGAGGGRSPSPQHPAFRSPSPSPTVPQGNLGPQNMGIALDASGGVAQDSMAEAYRRQYQQQQQQTSQHQPGQTQPRPSSFVGSPVAQPQQQYTQQQGYNPQQQQYGQAPKSPVGGPPPVGQRPTSQYGQQSFTAPAQAGQGQSQPGYGQPLGGYYNATAAPPQPHHQSRPSYSGQQSYQQQQPPVSPGGYGPNGYAQQQQPQQQQQQQYGGYQAPAPANQYARSASPAPMANQYARAASPAPAANQYARAASPAPAANQYARAASPAPAANQYARAASPAPAANHYGRSAIPAPQHQSQQQAQQYGGYGRSQSPQPGYQQQQAVQRSPSPQPGVPPTNAAPTGQWSTTGLPVLFYVKALYDYTALSPAEFDFQQGDIIAVTSTPEDGWWSGELLDEARRVPGRTDFPSNFVCLF